MGWSTFILLRLLHIIYALYLTLSSRWRHFTNTSSSSPSPSTLRQKIPRHLAIAFVVDSASENAYSLLLEAVENAIQWCRAAEISRLTVFDKSGILQEHSSQLRNLVPSSETAESCSESEIEYPLTPPLSEGTRSRSLSPTNDARVPELNVYTIDWAMGAYEKKKKVKTNRNIMMRKRANKKTLTTAPFTLHVTSSRSAHQAIACTACSLSHQSTPTGRFSMSADDLNQILEGPKGFPSPDLLVVQHLGKPTHALIPPLELHCFPPWQMRLSEIYHSPNWTFDETVLEGALEVYGGAEMRFGR